VLCCGFESSTFATERGEKRGREEEASDANTSPTKRGKYSPLPLVDSAEVAMREKIELALISFFCGQVPPGGSAPLPQVMAYLDDQVPGHEHHIQTRERVFADSLLTTPAPTGELHLRYKDKKGHDNVLLALGG
jgi:hypothetical protein